MSRGEFVRGAPSSVWTLALTLILSVSACTNTESLLVTAAMRQAAVPAGRVEQRSAARVIPEAAAAEPVAPGPTLAAEAAAAESVAPEPARAELAKQFQPA